MIRMHFSRTIINRKGVDMNFFIRVLVTFTMILTVLFFAACGSDSELHGRWSMKSGDISMLFPTYEFRHDGEGTWSDGRAQALERQRASGWAITEVPNELSFSWSSSRGRLEVLFENSDEPLIYYYEFTADGELYLRRREWISGATWSRME